MLSRILLPFAIACAVVTPLVVQAPAAYAQKTSSKSSPKAPTPAIHPAPPAPAPCLQFYLDRRPPAAATPPPADERVFCHSFYALSYSSARRNPVWTSYLLTRAMAVSSDAMGRHSRTFGPQAGLTAAEQANDDDWEFPPYARGHMTPDNDAPDRPTQADTYVVSNIIPQVSGFNSGLWSRLERAVHALAKTEREIYIVTGPIFGPPHNRMHGFPVPSTVFKAIYVPSRHFALAFISTNEQPTNCRIVSIAQLGREAGLDVFPSLPAADKASLPAMPRGWGGFPSRCRPAANDP